MDIGSSTSSSSISSTSSKKNTQLDIELVVLNPQKEDEATTSSPSDNNNNIENNLLPDTYYNRFHIWLHPPTKPRAVQLFRLENLAIPACYFLVGALQGLSGALMNVYPLDLGATEAQQVTVAALRSLPASFKLVYGFISDGHPLWGYRRKSYMVCGWTVAGISMVFLALPATPSIPYLHPPTKPRAVQLFRLENLAIPACYFLVGALQGLSGALMNVYPLDLGATEAQQVTVAALRSLPASFKLVYGFISDGHPLWGYRRKSYMVCGWTVAGISMVFLALPATPSIPYLSLCYFMFGLGFWYADVMADS